MTTKPLLSIDEQVDLLRSRGLIIPNEEACRRKLSYLGYYHLSGYGRFFQQDPNNGDNIYRPGTTFDAIAKLQELDTQLRQLCLRPLVDVEQAVRTRFAYHFGRYVGICGAITQGSAFDSVPRRTPTHEIILSDLDRSHQPFIKRYRTAGPTSYSDLPIWAAVESLSFGTLSKAIKTCKNQDVYKQIADDLKTGHQTLSSHLQAFVTLRNLCSHLQRLWNAVPPTPPAKVGNLVKRAQKEVGKFDLHSHYHTLVYLNWVTAHINPTARFLDHVHDLLDLDSNFRAGILNPKPYKHPQAQVL